MKPNRDIVAAALGQWDQDRDCYQRKRRRRIYGMGFVLILVGAFWFRTDLVELGASRHLRASGGLDISKVQTSSVEEMAHGLVVAQSRVLGVSRASHRPSRAGLQRARRSVSSLHHRLRGSKGQ